MTDQFVVSCVLRTGGNTYTPAWVWALSRALHRHMAMEYRPWVMTPEPGTWTFVCLTDAGDAVPVTMSVPLRHDWRGWWSKLELFRPGLYEGRGAVLALDLDTLPVADLSHMAAHAGGLTLLRDFSSNERANRGQSGLMLFRQGAETDRVWDAWTVNPAVHMRKYRGDGDFIHAHVENTERVQDLYPGEVVSYKKHARKVRPGLPVRIVCGHGRPRFSDKSAGWAHDEWSNLTRG